MTAGSGNRTPIFRSWVSTLNHWTIPDSLKVYLILFLLDAFGLVIIIVIWLSFASDDDFLWTMSLHWHLFLLRDCQLPTGIFLSFKFLFTVSLNLSLGLPIPRTPSLSWECRICFSSLELSILRIWQAHLRFLWIWNSYMLGSIGVPPFDIESLSQVSHNIGVDCWVHVPPVSTLAKPPQHTEGKREQLLCIPSTLFWV